MRELDLNKKILASSNSSDIAITILEKLLGSLNKILKLNEIASLNLASFIY